MDTTRTAPETAETPVKPRRSTKPVDGRRGDGRVYQRPNSSVWWIRFYYQGRDHRESAGTTSESEARRFLRHRLDQIGADRQGLKKFIGAKAERVRVGELLDQLLSDYTLRGKASAQLKAHLAPIRAAFGDRKAVSVTAAMVDRYISDRLAAEKKPATVNRETQLLGQAFRLGVEREMIAAGPVIRRLPERNTRRGFFERDEFEAVVAKLPDDLRDFARLACVSGWRKGELASLTWGDVDRAGRVIRLRPEEAKNGHGRTLALEGDLAALVERRWQARTITGPDGAVRISDLVFHRDGRPVGDFRKSWATACRAAGVAGRLLHDLRRTSVRNMVRAGVPERVAMEVSGHKTRSVFDRYNIVSEADLRAAMVKTQAYVDAQPTTRNVVTLASATGTAGR